MRIPGQGRANKKLSEYIGGKQKVKFEKFLASEMLADVIRRKLEECQPTKFELVTFTNSKSFYDLMLSIISFVSNVGIPAKWTLYADDDFSIDQRVQLELFGFVVYKEWFENVSPDERLRFGNAWQFRKYYSFAKHLVCATTIFLDSDVVFYPKFGKYKDLFERYNWYLPDPVGAHSIDSTIIERAEYRPSMFVINSGFLVVNSTPPWHYGMPYLSHCLITKSMTHFTEQSAVNIVFGNDPFAKILEPRVFHVSAIDQFSIGYVSTDSLAIRHYVGLVRYKMWQAGWRQFV